MPDYAETSHAWRHPPGNVFLCVTVGVRLHARMCKATVVSDLENGWTGRAQTWYIHRDQLVGWCGKVNWDLPCTCAHMFRVTVPDLENGWTDCVQIWYTVVPCTVSWRYPIAISHVQGPLSRTLRWSPQKAFCWFLITFLSSPGGHCVKGSQNRTIQVVPLASLRKDKNNLKKKKIF